MKTLLSLLLILCLAQSLQAQYLKAYTEGKRRETKEQYYDAILAYNAAYNTPDKPATNDLQKRIDFCANQLKKQQDEIKLALKTAKQEKERADSALVITEKERQRAEKALLKADEMQRDMEIVIIDKAIIARNPNWKGLNNYSGTELLKMRKVVDTLELCFNELTRIPNGVSFFNNLKFINLLGNEKIDWVLASSVIEKFKQPVNIYISVKNFDSIPNKIYKKVTGIEIIDYDLKQISNSIIEQTQLDYLRFSTTDRNYNYLSSNISEICKLTNLKYLYLNHCYIDSVPNHIWKLSKLIHLELQMNSLDKLPDGIWELTNLTKLNLMLNNLTTISSNIQKLKNLNYLDLGHNHLTILPNETGSFTKLTYLNLECNDFTNIPKEIGLLTNLENLNVNSNKLTDLPQDIWKLTNLTNLNLGGGFCSHNQLTAISSEIKQLRKLKNLDLSSNQLKILPKEIGELRELKIINLYGNDSLDISLVLRIFANSQKEIRITNDFYAGSGFTELVIVLPKITTLTSEIGSLKNIKHIDLFFNKKLTLPKEIGNLINLSSLDLQGNGLSDIPKEIGNLKNLERLNLGSHWQYPDFKNQLTSLPSEIGNLNNLTYLCLRDNQLTSLPLEIKNCKKLETLILKGNNFSEAEQQKIKTLLPTCKIEF